MSTKQQRLEKIHAALSIYEVENVADIMVFEPRKQFTKNHNVLASN